MERPRDFEDMSPLGDGGSPASAAGDFGDSTARGSAAFAMSVDDDFPEVVDDFAPAASSSVSGGSHNFASGYASGATGAFGSALGGSTPKSGMPSRSFPSAERSWDSEVVDLVEPEPEAAWDSWGDGSLPPEQPPAPSVEASDDLMIPGLVGMFEGMSDVS